MTRLIVMVSVVIGASVAAAGPFELHDPVSGASGTFTAGRVTQHGSVLDVTLSDRDPGCGAPSGTPHYPHFVFSLAPGPGGTFYAGAKVGVSSLVFAGATTMAAYGPEATAITLAPVKLDHGAHVTGSIKMPYGSGTFDAIVCPGADATKLRALPGSAPATPFGGTVGRASFAVKSALALVERRKDAGLTIAELQLHATAGVTCKAKDAAPGAVVYVIDIGGASSIAKLTGSPQPALASMTKPMMSYSNANVWVQLDKVAFETGGKVTGRAVVDAADAKLAGAFTATVCGP